jgi:hypothetical protein
VPYRGTARVAAGLLILGMISGCGGGSPAPQATPAAQEQDEAEAQAKQPTGVSLGEFVVRDYHPVEGVRSMLRFELYAEVPSAELTKIESLLSHRRHKLRNHVITAARTVTLTDFEDPKLELVRRRILMRLRRAIPELPLKDVLLTQYEFALES